MVGQVVPGSPGREVKVLVVIVVGPHQDHVSVGSASHGDDCAASVVEIVIESGVLHVAPGVCTDGVLVGARVTISSTHGVNLIIAFIGYSAASMVGHGMVCHGCPALRLCPPVHLVMGPTGMMALDGVRRPTVGYKVKVTTPWQRELTN